MGRSRGLRLLANSAVPYSRVPVHTRVYTSPSSRPCVSVYTDNARHGMRDAGTGTHVRAESRSHKARSPSGR